jgi:hypothetical protein
MTPNNLSSEINISKWRVSSSYYQLKILWTGVKHLALREFDTNHGLNCLCCSTILQSSNDKGKKESKMDWKLDRSFYQK